MRSRSSPSRLPLRSADMIGDEVAQQRLIARKVERAAAVIEAVLYEDTHTTRRAMREEEHERMRIEAPPHAAHSFAIPIRCTLRIPPILLTA
jgi:hypothetical protein